MKVRTDFRSVNLATGEKTRSIVGDGQVVDEKVVGLEEAVAKARLLVEKLNVTLNQSASVEREHKLAMICHKLEAALERQERSVTFDADGKTFTVDYIGEVICLTDSEGTTFTRRPERREPGR